MRTTRPFAATHPRRFGRARAFVCAAPSAEQGSLSDDLQLFAATFAAGFVFVSVLIG